MVYDAAFAEAEEKYGKLLETCDEGTKCREDIIAEIKTNIKKIWKQVLVDFEKTIEGSISETKREVSVAWDHLVTCGEEANCCQYEEIIIQNLWLQVTRYREAIVTETTKWYDFEDRRKEIINTCPERTFECLNSCADGSARVGDCECLSFDEVAHPACPNSLCADGTVRDAETCSCPDRIELIEVAEEPVAELPWWEQPLEFADPEVLVVELPAPTDVEISMCKDESTIKWEIPEHSGHFVLKYEIMVAGHLVTTCKQAPEKILQVRECLINTSIL